MLHQPQHLQSHIKRSLDNLKYQSPKLEADQMLAPFTYCTHLLTRYAQETKPHEINSDLFRQFRRQVVQLSKRDKSSYKVHHVQIYNQIINIIDGDIFERCQCKIKDGYMRDQKIHKMNGKLIQTEKKQQDIQSDKSYDINLSNSIKKKTINQTTNLRNLVPPSNSKQQSIATNQTQLPQQQQGQLYKKLLTAYKQHRIDQAYHLKQTYMKKYVLDDQKKDFFDTIDLQYNTMISFYKEFDQDGWQLDKQQNGTRLEYKIFPEQKEIGVKVSAEVDVPIDHFLSILCQIDLFQKYVPFVYDSRQLKVISRNQKIGTSKVFIPLLSDREVYFYAAGYDRIKQNGSVFLFSKTLNEDKVYQKKYGYQVPQKTDYVRLEYKFYIIQYIPIGLNQAKVRLACKADMKLNFIPKFIINMSARKFAFDYFKHIPKLSKKFKGSEWDKKMQKNPQFYNFFKQKIKEYLGGQQ